MAVVTEEFIEDVIRTGSLAQAAERTRRGAAHPRSGAQWDKLSTWSLICEEILDTEDTPQWYDAVVGELLRRGFSYEQLNQMRRFAWRTAGWLNYDKMLWDWVSLDEDDIHRALDWQLRDGLITATQHARSLAYLSDPTRSSPP